MHDRCLTLTVGLLVALTAASARSADEAVVTIEEVQWGFDGKAQERTFTPLSVLVQNNTPLEFEGTLTLTKLVQSTKPIDASIRREVYLGPLSSRWVQFVPYVVSDWEQWRLSWGDADDEQYEIPTPQIAESSTVLLYDPQDLQLSGGVLRRFPMNLFPASVTGTDGLRGLVMDYAPRWQGARRQAFLDWLTRGGQLFLLRDEQGRFPTFPESLRQLNGRGDEFLVGAGTVRRIATTVHELEPDFVKTQILAQSPQSPRDQRYQQYRNSPQFDSTAPMINRSGWDRDTQMFLDLQSVTRFARQWWVIYLLSLLYLFALFPVCFRIGRQASDYRWMYVVLLGTVAVFSLGFASLSRLGASEVSRARSVAVARQLGEGVYDVTQWTCVGVRAAGDYTVTHSGTGGLYTTSQDTERIDGHIVAGVDARMELQIPPASTRTVLYRGRAQATSLGLNVRQSAYDERGLSVLSINVGPDFPAEPIIMLVAQGSHIFQLQRSADQLVLVNSSRKTLASYLTDYFQLPQLGMGGMQRPKPDDQRKTDDVYALAVRTLVGNSFGLADRVDLQKLVVPRGMVRVYVYAAQLPQLQITSDSFPDQSGCVLYCVDLPTSGARPVRADRSELLEDDAPPARD